MLCLQDCQEIPDAQTSEQPLTCSWRSGSKNEGRVEGRMGLMHAGGEGEAEKRMAERIWLVVLGCGCLERRLSAIRFKWHAASPLEL